MISECLSTGAENAITGKEICKLLNISHRELTKAVEIERREGKPICAEVGGFVKGYFLAANQDEMKRYCNSLKRRITEIHKTETACNKAIGSLPE